MFARKFLAAGLVLLAGFVGGNTLLAADAESWDGKIVQYGKMHEAIGQKQHQGRVQLLSITERPHFFGVAALAQLDGEATILDGRVTVTRVNAQGELEPSESTPSDASATLLVGAYVPSWSEHKVGRSVTPDELDEYLADEAARAGIRLAAPFVFTLKGEFSNVRFHVIHGACPLHARLKNMELPKETRPFEAEFSKVQGTVVGVFAKDAVGDITHPATATHMHLVLLDPKAGRAVTGHVEQLGLLEGAILRLPRMK